MMAAVAKAQALRSNKTLILCIAWGKNCNAEMAKQSALVRASQPKMASQDHRGPGDCKGTSDFGERSSETESKGVSEMGKNWQSLPEKNALLTKNPPTTHGRPLR